MSRPVALIRAFGQQELPGFFDDAKEKRPVCCAANEGLHFSELDLKHFFKLLAPQGAEDYRLVQSGQVVCQTGMHFFVDSKRHSRNTSYAMEDSARMRSSLPKVTH